MSYNLSIRVTAIRNGFVELYALPVTIILCFPGLVQFFALFVLFRKTVVSAHKTVDSKAPDQVFLYSDENFFF